MSYLFDAAQYPNPSVYERAPGGSFWERPNEWLVHETSFNVDKVVTPVLFTAHGKGNIDPFAAYVVETLGAFRRNRRPIEYLLLESSTHAVQRPLEQVALAEVIVDWMVYWLQGQEDPSPHKAQQYERWRPLRAEQEEVLRTRR